MSSINWNDIYTKTSPKLLGICRRYIKDVATAEDIVQDSFIVAIQKENTLKDRNALNGWLSRIVINMAIHHLKETKKINFSTHQDYEIVDTTTVMNTLEIDSKSMLLSADFERNDILEAIDQLPEHHKSVFNMYVIDQFSHSEIGKILHISVGTSKSHLSRARKTIQLFLLERIKEKTVDEKKKRRIAFLLFLGFETQMFADFYKKPFQDFEITPKNTFELAPKNMSVPNQFIGLAKGVAATKITVVSIVFLCILGTLFYGYDFRHDTITPKEQPELNVEPTANTTTSPFVINLKDSAKNESPTINPDKPKNTLAKEKTGYLTTKTPKTLEKTIATTPKDSVKSEPKKVVIIKRQIVKKDTIYVSE